MREMAPLFVSASATPRASSLVLVLYALAFISASASAAAPLQLCALVTVETAAAGSAGVTQLFAAIRADGALGANVRLTEEALSGLLAGDAATSRFFNSPPPPGRQVLGPGQVEKGRSGASGLGRGQAERAGG